MRTLSKNFTASRVLFVLAIVTLVATLFAAMHQAPHVGTVATAAAPLMLGPIAALVRPTKRSKI